jgi:hypothetical protein
MWFLASPLFSSGRGGIRTHGPASGTPDFESGAFDQLSHPSTCGEKQGGEDIEIRRLVDDLVDFFFLRMPSFLTEVFVVVRQPVHGVPQNTHYFRAHGVEPLGGPEK